MNSDGISINWPQEGKIDPVIGRENEIERVIQILSRRTKNNPVLIGEPGVGKTAIAEGLAQRIIDGRVPEVLRDKRVVSLNMASMVAGSKYRGEFEERMKKVMDEIRRVGKCYPVHRRTAYSDRGRGSGRGHRRRQHFKTGAGPRRTAGHRRHHLK